MTLSVGKAGCGEVWLGGGLWKTGVGLLGDVLLYFFVLDENFVFELVGGR